LSRLSNPKINKAGLLVAFHLQYFIMAPFFINYSGISLQVFPKVCSALYAGITTTIFPLQSLI